MYKLATIEVYECTCENLTCRHSWTTRKLEVPAQCPKCHSPNWNKPKSKQPRLGVSL